MNPMLDALFSALPPEDKAKASDLGAEEISKRLSAAEQMLTQQSENTKVALTELEANKRESNAARTAQNTAIKETAEAVNTSNRERQILAAKTENNVIDAVGDSANVEYLSQLMTEIRNESSALDDLYDQARDISNEEVTGIGFLDTIINNARIKMMQPKIEAHKAALAGTQNELSSVSGAADYISNIQNKTAKSVNQEIIDADAKANRAKAEAEIQANEVNRAATNAGAVVNMFNMQGEELKNAMSAVRLAQQERAEQTEQQRIALQTRQQELTAKRLQFEEEQWEQTKEDAATRSELLSVQLESARENLQHARTMRPSQIAKAQAEVKAIEQQLAQTRSAEQDLVTRINRAEAALGLPVTNSDTIKEKFHQEKGTEVGNRMRKLYLIGGGSDNELQLGASPYSALKNISELSPNGIPKNLESAGLKLAEAALVDATTQVDPTTGKVKQPATEQEMEDMFNRSLAKIVVEKSSNIQTTDYSNPFHAPPLKVLTGYSTAIKGSKFYKEVVSKAEAGMNDADPHKLLELGAAAVKSGVLKPAEVVDGIELMFDTAVEYNNTMNGGFSRYGIDPQASYNALVKPTDTSGLLSKTGSFLLNRTIVGGYRGARDLINGPEIPQPTDFTDPVQIENVLTKYVIATPTATTNEDEDN